MSVEIWRLGVVDNCRIGAVRHNEIVKSNDAQRALLLY